MAKVASNESAASNAVSGVNSVVATNGEKVNLGGSNLSAMKSGESVANQMLSDLGILLTNVKKQAAKFPKLAMIMSSEDAKDASKIEGGNRR